MKLKIDTKTIQTLNPCKDRFDNWLEHYDNKTYTVKQFFALDNITHSDKLWVVLRLVSNETKVIFALDCAFDAAAAYAYAADAYADADAADADAAVAAAYVAAAADADAAAYVAAAAAAYVAAAYADAARKAKQAEQLEVLIYLIEGKNYV